MLYFMPIVQNETHIFFYVQQRNSRFNFHINKKEKIIVGGKIKRYINRVEQIYRFAEWDCHEIILSPCMNTYNILTRTSLLVDQNSL
jgi:hypothetical protein